MAPPPPADEYLASGFDSSSLTMPQLRSILLEHNVQHLSLAKKAELVALFDANVRSQANKLLSAPKVKASSKGVTIVSENGSETASVTDVPAKRGRGRPRKTATAEPEEVEPPAKKARGGRTKKATATVEPEEIIVIAEEETVAKKPRRSRKTVSPVVEIEASPSIVLGAPVGSRVSNDALVAAIKAELDEGAEAEVEDEATPPPTRKGKARASFAPASPASGPSAPSSTRRRTLNQAPDFQTPSETLGAKTPGKTPSRVKSSNSLRRVADVKEESEKEDEPAPKSVKKTPRKSVKEDPGAFSDYNPFQSGSEAAADRERRRRKSSIGLGQAKPRQPRFSEPAPKPATPSGGILRRVGPSTENLRTPSSEYRSAMLRDRETYTADDHNREVEERFDLDRQVKPQKVTARLANEPTSDALVRRVHEALPVVTSPRFAIPTSLLLLLLLSLLGNYKSTSASLGYCDPTDNTNDLILNRQIKLDNALACVARRAHVELDDPEAAKSIVCDVKALPLIPFAPRPTSCTPCPAHAICEDGTLIACQPEYIMTHSPLAFLGPVIDGLPGVGPKAFPPTCRPDTARKRMIGGLAMEMEKELAKGRGHIVCAGMGHGDIKKGDGARFGVTEDTLRERFAARRDPKFSREMFNELFDAALNDLVEHDDVIESIDIDGISWYAASRTDLTIGCRAKLEAMDLLRRWKSQLGSTLAVLATIAWLRSTVLRRKEEKYRAEELVQVVLKRLQDQETLHYADPVTTPNPFIPPAQLRDLVLPPTGSKSSRNRLWEKVNDLIEANSNVATREREVRGEVWKTWEWQGVGERRVTWEN